MRYGPDVESVAAVAVGEDDAAGFMGGWVVVAKFDAPVFLWAVGRGGDSFASGHFVFQQDAATGAVQVDPAIAVLRRVVFRGPEVQPDAADAEGDGKTAALRAAAGAGSARNRTASVLLSKSTASKGRRTAERFFF